MIQQTRSCFYVPPPLSGDEIDGLLIASGHRVGKPADFGKELPLLEVNGVYLTETMTYRLATHEITFDQALADPSTIVPRAAI